METRAIGARILILTVVLACSAASGCIGTIDSPAGGDLGSDSADIRPVCGDGACRGGRESCSTCPADCGTCSAPSCGDGTCAATETCSTCSADCGACPPPPPPTTCTTSLQSLIDAAPAGSTLDLPACIFRARATVAKALTIRGVAGTEIRGSDVWTAWTQVGTTWVGGTLPTFFVYGSCRSGTSRCQWPEQVFFDGVALRQVASGPVTGQFAMDSSRHVVLGQNPSGHVVEVTTRSKWVDVTASDVTIDGVTMRHAANAPQGENAALDVSGGSRFILRRSALFDVHGTLIGVAGGSGHRIEDNELARGGQNGFGLPNIVDSLVARNRIHDNNTEDFDPGWEAGAGKAGRVLRLTFDANDVYANAGPGLWCDIDCNDVTYSNNRTHHNEGPGIFFEISNVAHITGNIVWENAWRFPAWGWGAGILISSSSNAEVSHNVVAWNPDGISVISQNRPAEPIGSLTDPNRWNNVRGNYVHDNDVILAPQPSDSSDKPMLAWLQDWAGIMYDSASNNRGAANRYWHSQAEPSWCRFAWSGCRDTIAGFNGTPGEEGGRYLSLSERDAVLSGASVPLSPIAH